MLKEFKEFAMKGSVIDLAVGVVIGAAFQNIIYSLVNSIIMPLIAALLGQADFSDLSFVINNTKISYGVFLTAVVNFLIVAFSLFLTVKFVNNFNKKLEQAGGSLARKLDKDGKLAKTLGMIEEEVKEEVKEEIKEETKEAE